MLRFSRLLFILFATLTFSHNGKTSASIVAALHEAGPVLKRVGKYFDSEVVDTVTITYCTTTGASLGHAASIKVLETYYGFSGKRFNSNERLEDDLGYWMGLVIGHHVGKLIVKGRHNITDVVFPAFYDVTAAAGQASLVFFDTKTQQAGNWISSKLSNWKERLQAYANQKQSQESGPGTKTD